MFVSFLLIFSSLGLAQTNFSKYQKCIDSVNMIMPTKGIDSAVTDAQGNFGYVIQDRKNLNSYYLFTNDGRAFHAQLTNMQGNPDVTNGGYTGEAPSDPFWGLSHKASTYTTYVNIIVPSSKVTDPAYHYYSSRNLYTDEQTGEVLRDDIGGQFVSGDAQIKADSDERSIPIDSLDFSKNQDSAYWDQFAKIIAQNLDNTGVLSGDKSSPAMNEQYAFLLQNGFSDCRNIGNDDLNKALNRLQTKLQIQQSLIKNKDTDIGVTLPSGGAM
jgi:hypothetical protein